ncbi:MAG: hypothetical protein AB7V13_06240 [Pseudorhodoplanes sp.]|uniref:hypothetical protein n=1 Tax=Pseudorhodoplanes sp. TaxID=1934341 RepID=UPI003D0DC0FD
MAAKLLGLAEVPVIQIGHLTDAERRAYTIADNRIAEDAKWDMALLERELRAVVAEGIDAVQVVPALLSGPRPLRSGDLWRVGGPAHCAAIPPPLRERRRAKPDPVTLP